MRRVGGTRREIDEERLVRCQRLLVPDPGSRLVCHVGQEVVARVVRQLDRVSTVIDIGRPLVGLATEKAEELVEPPDRSGWPADKGPGDAGFPRGGLVPLPKSGGAVPIVAQHLGNWSHVVGNLAGVAREGRAGFDDPTHVVDVVIAPALDRCPRRRADGGGMEVVEVDPLVGNLLECRGAYGPTELAGASEAEIIDQDHDYVRCTLRCLHLETRWRRRIAHVQFDVLRRLWRGDR